MAPQKKTGQQTITFHNPPVFRGNASVAGAKEGQGPLGRTFDVVLSDTLYGEETWEKAERKMLAGAFLPAPELQYPFPGLDTSWPRVLSGVSGKTASWGHLPGELRLQQQVLQQPLFSGTWWRQFLLPGGSREGIRLRLCNIEIYYNSERSCKWCLVT